MKPSFSSLTRPIPEDKKASRGWRIFLNGEIQPDVFHLVIDHPSFGTLTYGLAAGGHDGWSFHEHGGGGAVILPFCLVDDELFVGLVEQDRPLQGGPVLNAPRGFLDPNERHAVGAQRELFEEMGLEAPKSSLIALPGAPANPNSTFFETAGPEEGVRFFALEIPRSAVTQQNPDRYGFKSGVIAQDGEARQHRLAEKIGKAAFLPWYQAAMVGDMITNAAVARLLAARRTENQHP